MGYHVGLTEDAAFLLYEAAQVGMQDFSRLVHLCHYALETQHLDGDIVEFGCFKGDSAKLLTFITNKQVHVYDSFMGLPETGVMGTSADSLVENFQRHGVRPPHIHKGWFSDIKPSDLPERIAFAHLDGDLYISTMQPLRLVYDRMQRGGAILIDDYEEPYGPGPKQACDEFFADKPEKVLVLQGMNGLKSYKGLVIKA